MKKQDIIKMLDEITSEGDIVSSIIQVVGNSCEFNDYFEQSQTLEIAHEKQENLLEIVEHLQLYYF